HRDQRERADPRHHALRSLPLQPHQKPQTQRYHKVRKQTQLRHHAPPLPVAPPRRRTSRRRGRRPLPPVSPARQQTATRSEPRPPPSGPRTSFTPLHVPSPAPRATTILSRARARARTITAGKSTTSLRQAKGCRMPRFLLGRRGRFGAAARHYVGDLVYGANDGIITTFAVVAGVAGADL